jgi:lipopolysaccharide biosynthesis glycosyltransferase
MAETPIPIKRTDGVKGDDVNEKKTMDILMASNRAYVPHINVMLRSLYLNNPRRAITVHIFHSALTGGDINALSETVRAYGGTLVPYVMSEAHRKLTAGTQGIAPETFYRLLCAEYLPDTIERALYLDGDIIVNGPIDELFDMDIANHLFAAATDPNNYTVYSIFHKQILGLPLEMEFVNAGVLLINLTRLRETGATAEIIKHIPYYGAHADYHDQDLLNALFYKDIVHFDSHKYNYFPVSSHSRLDGFRHGYPAIIHFGGPKPWDPLYPMNGEYTRKAKAVYDFYASL